MRQISFSPGHRQKFWHHNCVAIGMAAGFYRTLGSIGPRFVELSANMIAEQLPQNRKVMDIVSKRFNEKFLYRWDTIIDFLKLHYVLTKERIQTIGGITRIRIVLQRVSQKRLSYGDGKDLITKIRCILMKCFHQQVISIFSMGWGLRQILVYRPNNQKCKQVKLRKNYLMKI